jgi:division protein CdvB (Snf7/Vps24/ESCRT-III family)
MTPVIILTGIQGMRIKSKWIKSESMLEERKGVMVKTIALKPRIEIALNNIKNEVTKLAYIYTELGMIEMKIRETTNSYSLNDDTSRHGNINHAELFQSRRKGMTIIMSMISLEIVADRLKTAKDISEVVNALAPTIAIMKSIRSALIRYVSNTQEEISDICEILELVLMDSCQLSNGVLDFKEANHEAILLLNDAHMMAEQKMREEFPDLTKIFSKRVS